VSVIQDVIKKKKWYLQLKNSSENSLWPNR